MRASTGGWFDAFLPDAPILGIGRWPPGQEGRVSELDGFDEVRWFGGPRNILPTCRAIAEHARDIYEADLSYPIILSPSGEVLDGWHRICKAFVQGIEELDAVQLTKMPPYRWRVLLSGEEVQILEGSEGSHEDA